MKLIENLKLIHKANKELDRLERFVSSSYHNKGQQILPALLNELLKSYPNYNIDEEEIYKIITDREKFSMASWRSYCSQLNGLVEQFLIQEQLQENTFFQQQLLAKAYQKRKSANEIKVYEKMLNDEKNSFSVEQKAKIYRQFLVHSSADAFPDADILEQAQFYTDCDFLFKRLRLALTAAARQQVYQQTYNLVPISDVVKMAQLPVYQTIIRIKLYTEVLQLYSDKSETFFKQTVQNFKENYQHLDSKQQKELFSHIQNQITQKINTQGNLEAYQIAHEWFSLGLKEKFIAPDNKRKLSEAMFMNIANTAAIVNVFEECEHFIKTYQSLINSKSAFKIVLLCEVNLLLCRYQATKKDDLLAQAQAILLKIAPKSLFLKLNCRIIDLKISYYKEDVVENKLLNFKLYLDNQTKMEEHKKLGYINFCSSLKEIVRLQTLQVTLNQKEYDIRKYALLEVLKNTKVLSSRFWLTTSLLHRTN